MIRVFREFAGFSLYVGGWAGRFALPWSTGTFGNGSKWFSGWYRWDEDDLLY